ncbi:MAG: SpoIIE family protein phosphatase [Armatimonadetes bacterium]|nr:SpoIIE family protein phosphatase [Armatimonadota bacterium]
MQAGNDTTETENATPVNGFLAAHLSHIRTRTDRGFGVFLLIQWLAALLIASWVAPVSFFGGFAGLPMPVQRAVLWGALITLPTAALALRRSGETATRYTVAVCQMLMSALLIDLTNGRIETHFHVFVSLAFLAFYLDMGVLGTACAVILVDQAVRGAFFPATVWGPYGQSGDTLLWTEHALWIAFMGVLGALGVRERLRDLRRDGDGQALLFQSNAALQNSETQFRQLAEDTDRILFMTDAQTGVGIYASPLYIQLWKTPTDTPLSFLTRIAPEHRDWARAIWQGAADGVAGLAEVLLDTGEWMRLRTFPVRGGTDQVYRVVLTAADISTEKLREQDQLQAYERERRIASTMQSMVLAHESVPIAGIQIAPFYRPALFHEAAICGDFFDTVTLPDDKIAVIVGDVSGKGLDAARHMTEVKYALRAYLRDSASPGEMLAKLSRYLCESFPVAGGRVGTERFVALSLAVVDTLTGETVIACGGIEPPLLVRGGAVTVLEEAGGLPLGILPDAVYDEVSLTLSPGDTLVMVSDGVTEARNFRRELLGLDGWEAIVRGSVLAHPALSDAAEAALSCVTDHAQGELSDDACGVWVRKE